MTEVPSWHTPAFPEYRASAPWVMEDMIALESRLTGDLERLAGAVAPLAEAVEDAVGRGAPIVVIGCGTAWHAAQGFADVLGEALGNADLVTSRQSFEAALAPRGGLCIAVSDSGRTKPTRAALEAAKAAGAVTALVTASPSSAVAEAAELIVETMALDESWCHTLAYLAPIVTSGVLGAADGGAQLDRESLQAAIDESSAAEGLARELAASLHGVARLLIVGSGADEVAARELSLKVEEGAYIPCAVHQVENVLHGHLVPCDDSTGLVLLVTDRRGRVERAERAEAALRYAEAVGTRAAAILAPDAADRIDDGLTGAGRIVVADRESLPAALASYAATAAAFQYLAVGLADCAGVNPDFCRQDTDTYRRAFQLGNSKIPRAAAGEAA